jgi:hypothetical protein
LIPLGQPSDLFGEDPPWTVRVQAPESAHQQPDRYRPAADRVVGQLALVAAMHPARRLGTHRAHGRPSTGRGIEPDHPVSRDHIINANASQVREQELKQAADDIVQDHEQRINAPPCSTTDRHTDHDHHKWDRA